MLDICANSANGVENRIVKTVKINLYLNVVRVVLEVGAWSASICWSAQMQIVQLTYHM